MRGVSVPAPRGEVLGTWARARPDARRPRAITIQPLVVSGVLLFSLALIRAPVLLTNELPLAAYALTLLPFCVAVVLLALSSPSWHARPSVLLAVGYIALIVIAAVRGSYVGALSHNTAYLEAAQFTLLVALGTFAFLREPRDVQRARYVRALCWAPVVFVAANVVLHVLGVSPAGELSADSGQPATMLGLLGVPTDRVVFPMSGGLNGVGPTAAAALVICATFVLRRTQVKLAILGALVSLYVILAIDSRGALLFGALAFALVTIAPRARKRGLGWVAILLPVLPVVLVLALTGLAETDAGTKLDRGASEGLSTGTGRTVVWGQVASVLTKPRIEHLVGYGQNGQVTSGASLGYAYLFRNEPDPLSRSAHSVVLQTVLDVGWIGLLCLIVLAKTVLSRLGRRAGDASCVALLTGTLALFLIGIVQSDPTPAHPDSFAFWVLVMFVATRAGPEPGTPRAST
jgi:hypothetical protein